MSTDNVIKLQKENGIVTLTLNAPNVRNAFNDQMIAILDRHLQTLKQDNSCRILILKGEGEHFSAGADVAWMQRMAKASADENYQDALKLAQLLHELNHFNKPTIALVQGSITSQTEYTAHLIAKLRVSEEGQEGLSAFLEKRKPNWQKDSI